MLLIKIIHKILKITILVLYFFYKNVGDGGEDKIWDECFFNSLVFLFVKLVFKWQFVYVDNIYYVVFYFV